MKKVTVIFEDDELYTAVKVQAARLGRSLKEIVTEAMESWLDRVEEAEELSAHRASVDDYRKHGGISWERVEARMEHVYSERAARGDPTAQRPA